jgi:hypothetical protein
MSNNARQIIPIAGLLGTAAFAIYMVTLLDAQAAVPTDLTNAAVAEVHDAQGQIILRGQFAVVDEQNDDDVERKAALQPAGTDADAAGEAEIEFAKSAPAHQEIEFSVRNLAAGTSVTFLIDGHVIGQAAVDRRGRAELDIEVRMPGAPATSTP